MDILDCIEDTPASRPSNSISEAVYLRFEAWCKYRWGEREIVWIVRGAGVFQPPIQPATITQFEQWTGTAWSQHTPDVGALGAYLPLGTWRITATVGDNTVRADVEEAAGRYERYMEATEGEAGIMQLRDGDYSVTRSVNAVARALQYSGAADLLRTYR